MDRSQIFSVATFALLLSGSAASSGSPGMPANASATDPYDWTGFYVGAHVGYGTGRSNWAANPTGAPGPSISGSVDLFSRAGGYLGGFQWGYNYQMVAGAVIWLHLAHVHAAVDDLRELARNSANVDHKKWPGPVN